MKSDEIRQNVGLQSSNYSTQKRVNSSLLLYNHVYVSGTRTIWKGECAFEEAWEVTASSGGSGGGLYPRSPEKWGAGKGPAEQIGTSWRENQEFLYSIHICKVSTLFIILGYNYVLRKKKIIGSGNGFFEIANMNIMTKA